MIQIVRLLNIQSYKDVTFEFSEKINVFDAPNETGKSVIFKVFRTMCDANWYGRGERKSIIRRGEDKGTALIVVPYAGGNVFKIVFEIYKTYQVYHLYDGNDRIDSWKQDTIPSDILDILGWYYDKDSKVLLNLCDQELDMPFVNSNTRFNYEVMKFIIQNPELETARTNLTGWIKDNTDEIENLSLKCRTLEGVISGYKYVDTASLTRSISTREEAVKKGKVLLNLLQSLNSISELSKPKEIMVDSKEIDKTVEIAEKLRKLGITLQDVLKLQKPSVSVVESDKVESAISTSMKLNVLAYKLLQVKKILDDRNSTKLKLQNAREVLEDFERENKVCPLCGNLLDNHNHDVEE